MKRTLLIGSILLLAHSLFAAPVTVTSPNGRNAVIITADGGELTWSLSVDGRTVLAPAELEWEFKGMPELGEGLEIISTDKRNIDDTWKSVWGTHSSIRDHAAQTIIRFQEKSDLNRKLDLYVRAYDDGVAFRYGLPEQPVITDFKLAAEETNFRFTGNHTVWAVNHGSFHSSQENEYKKITLSDLRPGQIIGCPLLVEAGNVWLGLTEANLTDWAGMYFTGGEEPFSVTTLLSPRPDEPDVAVISTAPRTSPWRVVLIGDQPGQLIDSNLILNLNEPCQIADPSWITPGMCAWDRWWCGSYAPDYDGHLGVDNPSMQYFIDFAADMGWEYQLVDWYWYGNPFDPNVTMGTAPNPDVSILKQAKGIDIPGLVQYANSKGVKLLIWLDNYHAAEEMEQAFPLYEQWGVSGVKVDFMDRDDQLMVNWYRDLVKLAAKYHLTVDFHGAYKPTGISRTWPNLLTREGVLGNEYNKWSDRITLEHTVTLPFTRMLCGQMDFTPGGFRNKNDDEFRVVGGDAPGPFVRGTRCHQLAMQVVYESALQVMCDSPYNYRMSPAGLDFLKIVPTTWDDSRVLAGYPGQYIVMARRSGDEWFIGAMTGDDGRSITIDTGVLGKSGYHATLWTDADEVADYPDRLWKTEKNIKSGDTLEIKLAPGGGAVVHLVPVK